MIISLLLAAAATQAPVPAGPLQNRLNVYQHTESVCKAVILSDKTFSSSIVRGTKGMNAVCECAATMTVGSLTDEQAAKFTDPVVAKELADRLQANTLSCIDIRG